MKESKKKKKVAFNNRGRQELLRETTNEGWIPPKRRCAATKETQIEGRARTHAETPGEAGRGERERHSFTQSSHLSNPTVLIK